MDLHDGELADNRETRPAWELALDAPKIPANVEAERALLGALLIANRAAEYVPDLKPDHFFFDLHAHIFAAILEGFEAGRIVNATTLAPRFRAYKIDAATDGAQYLGRLITQATTVANVRDYARTVIDLAQRRALLVVADELAARATDPQDLTPPSVLVEEAERALFLVSTQGRGGREVSLQDATRAAVKAASKAHKLGGKIDGVQTGLIDFDRQVGGGLGNSDLIVLGGRPSMGKTALATKIALNVARGMPGIDPDTGEVEEARPRHVHFFSLEMSGEQLAGRLLSDLSGVPSNKIRRGDLTEAEFRLINEASAVLSDMPMTIDETGGISIGALTAKARREKRKHGTSLIVVDYLQLMKGSGNGYGNRVQEITEITVGLKALAKELRVPVLALSQLNRGLEKQEDKRPQLSDLRESGSIEQDADVVLFVYREEYYFLRKNPEPVGLDPVWQADFEKVAGLAEVLIGKQRHGPIGTVHLAFDGKLTRFSNLAREHGR